MPYGCARVLDSAVTTHASVIQGVSAMEGHGEHRVHVRRVYEHRYHTINKVPTEKHGVKDRHMEGSSALGQQQVRVGKVQLLVPHRWACG